jgi:release factor glutamine methyltransferase
VASVSVRDALHDGARRLAGPEVSAPEREARVLWAAVAHLHPAQVWIERDRPADPASLERFRALVERRRSGEPLAYVVGTAGFRTLDLVVDRRAFIPRPETEGLVESVLRSAAREWGTDRSWGRAVDVGTGSGCIALSLAVEGRFDRVVATDVSPDALALAQENVHRVAPPVPVELRRGALLEPLGDERFEVIVSNPPYVAELERRDVERSVLDHEPLQALFSGRDGLEHTAALLAGAPRHLVTGGLLAVELDCRRSRRALALARDSGWRDARVEYDLFGRTRFLLAHWE